MLRPMHMKVALAASAAAMGLAACSSTDDVTSACGKQYADVAATKSTVAGDVRFVGGPRSVDTPRNFPDLPDDAPVALCLVPDGKGTFAVYAVPKGSGPGQKLWTQNVGNEFLRPV